MKIHIFIRMGGGGDIYIVNAGFVPKRWTENHCLVVNAASVSYALFMTFYAGCFISASFAGVPSVNPSVRWRYPS